MDRFFELYNMVLNRLPADWQAPAALLLVLALAGAIWHVLRKSGPWLLALVILVPASIPILRGAALALFNLLRTLLDRAI